MAAFYGTIVGRSKSKASMTGSKSSGLQVEAMSWEGAVRVSLWHGADGRDWVTISVGPHGSPGARVLYRGPVAELWAAAYPPIRETA